MSGKTIPEIANVARQFRRMWRRARKGGHGYGGSGEAPSYIEEDWEALDKAIFALCAKVKIDRGAS